jgi:acyl-CoA synthetase (NDP forming)
MPSHSDQDRIRQIHQLIGRALAAGQTALDEAQAKRVLSMYGVPVPPGQVVRTKEAACEAARGIGFPVVMKAIGPDIRHKTEANLVALNVHDDAAVAREFTRLQCVVGDGFGGVLVEEMVKAERELMVGMKRDPAFGPAVAFGVGGVMTEALADIAVAVAPLDDIDTAELMDLIRAKTMLQTFRGYPAVDRAALSDILKGVGQIALDHPEIAELDINPLLTRQGAPIAADALVILAKPREEPPALEEPAKAHVDLRAVFNPKSVAVVGASADLAKWGGSLLHSIVEGGYPGDVFPVNPRGGVLFDLPVYLSLDDLPYAPDLVFIAVSAGQVEEVVAQCGRLGVSAAVVITAGFSEAGEEGSALEERIVRTARRAGVTLVGPNCMGLISTEARLHGTGFVSAHPMPGGLSVISQSGNVGYKLLSMAQTRGTGIAKFVSVGNEADADSVDVLGYLSSDAQTRVVLMYLEGVEDGRRLMEIARDTTMNKPIVVVRGGLTEFGSRAAASHTGALAGTAAVREASARQRGAVGTTSPDEGLDIALCLAHLPLPRGPRVAVVTLGGGWGVLAADDLARNGLALAELPAGLMEDLDQILPSFWSRANPIDLVTSGEQETINRVLDLVAGSDAVDAVLVLAVVGSPVSTRDSIAKGLPPNAEGLYSWDAAFMAHVAGLIAKSNKPIINVSLNALERSVYAGEGGYCPIVLSTPKASAQVLGQMAWYSRYLQSRSGSRL